MDVLDDDGRLIDQDADRQSQSAKRHQVDRLPGHPQRYHRCQDRQRDIHHHDQSAAPIAQEEQDHQSREHRAEQALLDQAQDGAHDEGRLVKLIADLHARRQHGLELWDILLDEIDDTERRGVGAFGDRNVDGAAAIDERVANFDIGRVGNRSNIADEDGAGSVGADGDVSQTPYVRHHRVHRNYWYLVAEAHVA